MVCRSLKKWCYVFGILSQLLGGIAANVILKNSCHGGGFYCRQEMKCIKSSQVCDYHQDCLHGEDEINCGSCDFSRDTCGYADDGNSQNIFKRHQSNNGIENIPVNDHTSKSNKSYFMMTSPNIKGKNQTFQSRCLTSSVIDLQCVIDESTSVLESSKLFITSPNCMLSFSYYYHSKEFGVLEIGHKQLDQDGYFESLLWSSELIPKRKWQHATIQIGQRPHGWSLFFRTNQMYVAIDDIKLNDCSYSRSTGTCEANQYQCQNGACINSTQICDFSRDCRDGSDENIDQCTNEYIERCNFEEDFCDWSQSLKDDVDWNRRSGIAKSYPPSVDHTSGTSRGYYAVLDASEHDEDKTAQLLSVLFKEGKERCHMQLYYHIDGGYGHSLTVKRRAFKDSNVTLELTETLSGQDNIWNHALVNISTEENFQVVIEAKIGHSRKGVIAVDDISFCPGCKPVPPTCPDREFSCGDGQCVPCESDYCVCNFVNDCDNKADEKDCQSSCDFEEENTCGWKNEKTKDENPTGAPPPYWMVYQGYTPANGTGPPYDHTKKTKKGHYVYVKGTLNGSNFPKAKFVSPVYNHGAYTCKFTFWYNMYHDRVQDKNDATLSVYYRSRDRSGNKRNTQIWTDSNTTGIKWKQGLIQLPRCPRDFNIVFVVGHYWNTHTDVAVDDWRFDCSEQTPAPCDNMTQYQCNISKQCVPLDSICDLDPNCCDGSDENEISCKGYTTIDFENGFVHGWMQLDTPLFDLSFDLHQGTTPTSNTGPTNDHTYREAHGRYIYLEASDTKENQTAAIASPAIEATTLNHSTSNTTCMVRFWYNMYGSTMGTLTVYTATTFGKPENQLWSISGNQGPEWKKQILALPSKLDFQVIFKATVGKEFFSDLALDDISLTPGCILASAALRGEPTPSPRNACREGEFYCLSNTEKKCIPRYEVCDFEQDCAVGEDESELNCGYPQGFEHGFSPWRNAPDKVKNGKLFLIHDSSASTPDTLPTTDAKGNATGRYMYFETTERGVNPFSALLESPWYKASYAECKLNVFYYIFGSFNGALLIHLVSEDDVTGNTKTDLIDIRGKGKSVPSQWHEINVSISRRREPFQIQIETIGREHVKIAIDEINFLDCGRPSYCGKDTTGQFRCQNQRCVSMSKVCDFVDDCGDSSDEGTKTCSGYMGCNFEEHPLLCNFTQDDTDDFDWTKQRGQTTTINTGPTHDHTKRTSQGTYMYIEASDWSKGQKARMKSFPIIARQNGLCRMKFYYHRFGSKIGDLNINVIINGQRILRKKFNDSSEFKWKEAVIDFSNETRIFQVEFEGVIGDTYMGDIAIDDIIFTQDCLTPQNLSRKAFPAPMGCNEKFTCKLTGNCIPIKSHCNNKTVDCKDGSDEEDCNLNTSPEKKSQQNSRYITFTVLSCLLIAMLLTAVMATVASLRRKRDKPYLFSIFYDPSAVNDTGHQVIKQSKTKKASTISSVSNPVYDNPTEKGEKKSICQFSRPCVDNSFPLYQEPFYISKPNLH